jgi:membrane protein
VIAAYAPSLQMRVAARPAVPGWRFELALAVLAPLAAAREGQVRGLSAAELAARLRVDPLQLEPLLELLAELDWVQPLAETDPPRHVLLCDPARTGIGPLAARTLYEPGPAGRAFAEAAALERLTLAQALGRG